MSTSKIKDETLQVPRKIRGTLEALGKDEYRFRPQGKGEPSQKNVVTCGNAKMYDTVGRKPQRMVCLRVDSEAPDVRSELFSQLAELTKDCQTVAETPPKPTETVVCLLKAEHVRLYVDEPQRMVRMYHEIPMVPGANYAQEMMNTMMKCNQALTVNREKIATLEKKGGEA